MFGAFHIHGKHHIIYDVREAIISPVLGKGGGASHPPPPHWALGHLDSEMAVVLYTNNTTLLISGQAT